MTYLTQQRAGIENNRMYEEDLPIHEWYRFVLSFPPHLVREYISKFEIRKDNWVLDPFCGTGTTNVECKKNGIPSVGLESNPVVQFLANTKLDWKVNTKKMSANAKEVSTEARRRLLKDGIEDNPALIDPSLITNKLRGLNEEQTRLLIKNSISPIPLHKSLVLRDVIEELGDESFINHFKLTFAKELVYSISNLKFGPEVGVGKKKLDAPVVELWHQSIKRLINDLELGVIKSRQEVPAFITLADSRNLGGALEHLAFSAVITSPPYPNEKDYTRTTRLESVILGFMRDRKDLKVHKQRFLRSNTRGVYKADNDEYWIAGNDRVLEISNMIEERRIELGKTSGFEKLYPRVVKLYFGGMSRHFSELKRILVPGAKLAYVVGDQASFLRVMIRTGEILGEIAKSHGYDVIDREVFRTRFSTATQSNLNEEVLILRWPG